MAYDHKKAARWCREHAQDRQPFVDACAWFASNGLWQGGLAMTDMWHNLGSEKVAQGTVLGSKTARVADRLVRFLIHMQYAEMRLVYDAGNTFPQPEFTRRIPDVQLGDIIAYKYHGMLGYYNHVAVVVKISDGIPYVSEWGTAHGPSLKCGYRSRRWYWSQNSRMPMTELYDLVVVHLRMK